MNALVRSLSTRIQLVAMLLVVIAFAAFALVLDYHQRQDLIEEYRAKIDLHLKISSARFIQSTTALGQDALFLSQTPPAQGILRAILNHGTDPRDGNSLEAWRQRLNEIFTAFLNAHPNYLRVSYLGFTQGGLVLVGVERQGHRLIIHAGKGQPGAWAQPDEMAQVFSLKPGQIYLSDFLAAADSSLTSLRAATPVYGPTGQPFGLMVLEMDASDLRPSDQALPTGLRVHVLDEHGQKLLPSNTPPLATPLLQAIPKTSGTAMLKIRQDQDWHYLTSQITHFDTLQPQRYVLMAYDLPASMLSDQLQPVRITLLVGGLALALLTGLLVWFYLRGIMQPLAKITRAARLIAVGKHALNLPRHGHSEIIELADAFRLMFDQITAREYDYQHLNAELEERVRQRTNELRLAANVLDNTSEGVMITDTQSRIVAINPAFTAITGYSAEEAIGKKPSLLRSAHHDPDFYLSMWKELSEHDHWSGEIWNRRKNGEVFLERLSINMVPGEDGRPTNYVGIFNDITDLWQRDEQIRYLAYHDALTGLPNRALLRDRLDHAMLVAERERSSLALLFLDLDRFKQVNDTLGHDIGDLLLKEVAQRIQSCLRETDTVARLGGDEFIVMLENLATRQPAGEIAESLISRLALPYDIKDKRIEIGVSIGISLFPDQGGDADLLIQHADQAMYTAKNAGRGVVRYFQDTSASL